MKISRIVAGAALAASLTAGAAEAASLSATGAVSIVGINASASSIGVGTTFTNTLFSIIGSATGDLDGFAGTQLTLGPVKASNGSAVSFTSAIGDFSGTVSVASASGPLNSRTVDIYALGTFTPTGSLSSYSEAAMSLTFSFTQTGGPDSAVSGSFSLSSPPVAPPPVNFVPEPMSLALFGVGLAGLGMVATRRKAEAQAA